jgi:hypothetical protein
MATVAGLAVVVVYATLAAWSGHISTMARGPLLDGLGPLTPYRWVNPPAALASTNQQPSSCVCTLKLGPNGVLGFVLITSDNQVTVVVDDGAIGPHPGDTTVRFLIQPEDPATFSPPPGTGVVTFGNAVKLSATYEPSGTPVEHLDKPLDVILAHPVTATLKPTVLDIYWSNSGKTWTKLDSTDSAVAQQVEAPVVRQLGLIQAAGVPAPLPLPRSSPGSGHLAIWGAVAAVCVLLIGIGFVLRSRGRSEEPAAAPD